MTYQGPERRSMQPGWMSPTRRVTDPDRRISPAIGEFAVTQTVPALQAEIDRLRAALEQHQRVFFARNPNGEHMTHEQFIAAHYKAFEQAYAALQRSPAAPMRSAPPPRQTGGTSGGPLSGGTGVAGTAQGEVVRYPFDIGGSGDGITTGGGGGGLNLAPVGAPYIGDTPVAHMNAARQAGNNQLSPQGCAVSDPRAQTNDKSRPAPAAPSINLPFERLPQHCSDPGVGAVPPKSNVHGIGENTPEIHAGSVIHAPVHPQGGPSNQFYADVINPLPEKPVPTWVTSWPDWFGIRGNVTVVPKIDYDIIERRLRAAEQDRESWLIALCKERLTETKLEALIGCGWYYEVIISGITAALTGRTK